MSREDALSAVGALVQIMARLRAPGGCPWDREQTALTLRSYVLEEAYEVVDAVERGDPQTLCDELGDLLLQVVFQAQLAAEQGAFTIGDVARAICDKLVRRHPHVFAGGTARDAAEVARNWQLLKDAERPERSADVDLLVPRAMPALPRAQKIGSMLSRRGFDWPDAPAVIEKVEEELRELRTAVAAGDRAGAGRELGDLLLAATSLARHLDVPAEVTLRDATGRLVDRVRRVEAAALALGRQTADLTAAELDRLWHDAKQSG
jgi:MazG family protein